MDRWARTHRLVVPLALAVSIIATVVPAQASPDKGAALDESGVGGFIGLNPVGPEPEGVITVGEPASTEDGGEPARPRYRIENGGDCIVDETENADGTIESIVGTTWLTVLADENADGNTTIVDAVCAVDAPPPPPPPPSPDEVWQFVPLAEARLGINPVGDGLTGLDTWLWHEGPDSGVSVAPTLRGYDLVVEARPVLYRWDMGEVPQAVYSSPSPGSEDQPVANHVYETKGDYEVTMQVVWEGSYEFSGFGVSNRGSLGSVTVTSSRDYHVAEARAVRR
jgi:hypothetical protein